MKRALLLAVATAAHAATLSVNPPVLFDCLNGLGIGEIAWTGATGPVEIRVTQADGPVFVTSSEASGTARTGYWVADGQKFVLRDLAGQVLATAIAHVNCGATPASIDTGLARGSYFPLQTGNTWVYRVNDRSITGTYITRSITGTEVIGGKTYYLLAEGGSVVARLRGDNDGVIWISTGSGEQVYFDPGSSAFEKTTWGGAIGNFSEALTITAPSNSLQMARSTFVRGIGLASVTTNMITGSSGGFSQSLDLVEVRLPGVRFSTSAASIGVSVESADLDVSGQQVANCALPCYFAACGLGFVPPDPPGTYRPCAQARIEATAKPGAELQLQLADASGAVVFSTSTPADPSGSTLRYIRVPLTVQDAGRTGFRVLAPGSWQITGRVLESGVEKAVSRLPVTVR